MMSQRTAMRVDNPPGSASQTQSVFWLVILAACLGCALCILSPVDRDEGAFLVIAQEVLHGRIPYRDVFDQKPPGIYYLLALLLTLTKPLHVTSQILVLRLFAVGANALAALGLAQLGKQWWKQQEVGRMAAIFWLVSCSVPLFAANQLFTEPFANVAVIWSAVRLTRRANARAMLEAGLLLAVGSLFKQTSILALPAFALLIYAQAATAVVGRVRATVTRLGVLTIGLGVPWLVVLGIYGAIGSISQIWYQVVIVNLVGYPSSSDHPYILVSVLLRLCINLLLIYSAPTVLLIMRMRSQHGIRSVPFDARVAATALLIVSFAWTILAHPYPHYFIQVLPWIALLTAVVIYSDKSRTPNASTPDSFSARLWRATQSTLTALPVGMALALALIGAPTSWRQLTRQIAVGQRIEAITPSKARILVAPADPEYYYLSGRLPTTPYVYLLPVNRRIFPVAQVTDDVQTRQFDVVVWSGDTSATDAMAIYGDMLRMLKQNYRTGPSGEPSITIFIQ